MKFITFQRRRGSDRGGLLVDGNRALDLGLGYSRISSGGGSPDDTAGLINTLRGLSSSILEILNTGDDALEDCFRLNKMALDGNLEDCLFSLGDTTLMAPIPEPPQVIHFNAFEEHARAELAAISGDPNAALSPAWHAAPVFHPGNRLGVTASGADVVFPESATEIDFEIQIAAVLGESIRSGTTEDADDAILGYSLAIAWVSRTLQTQLRDLGTGASASRFLGVTLGPCIVTKDSFPRPAEIEVFGAHNGERLPSARMEDAHFSFPEMISYASEFSLLPAGTILLAGCYPGGSGLSTGRKLKTGDTVMAEIDGLGQLNAKIHDRRRSSVFRPRR